MSTGKLVASAAHPQLFALPGALFLGPLHTWLLYWLQAASPTSLLVPTPPQAL